MAEEEAELRQSLVDALEKNGTLAKIKAQLRAAVFLAMDETQSLKVPPLVSQKAQQHLLTPHGVTAASVVWDFLHQLDMTSALSVFENEIGTAKTSLLSRKELLEKVSTKAQSENPVLLDLLGGNANVIQNTKPTMFMQPIVPEKHEETIITTKTILPFEKEKPSTIEKIKSLSSEDEHSIENSLKPPRLMSTSSNSLERSMDLSDSGGKSSLPAQPTLAASNGGTQLKSMLSDLPSLTPNSKPKSSLPPLTAIVDKRTEDKPDKQHDFSKLFSDAIAAPVRSRSETSDSSDSSSNTDGSSGSSSPSSDKKRQTPQNGGVVAEMANAKSTTMTPSAAVKGKVDTQPPNTDTSKMDTQTPKTDTLFKKPSPRDVGDADSVSEEIVEDLDVDDLLESAASAADSISF